MDTSTQIIAAFICVVAGVVSLLLFTRIQDEGGVSSDSHPTSSESNSIKSLQSAASSTLSNANSNSGETLTQNNSKSNKNDNNNSSSSSGWKCACEGGGIFLPPSLMKNLGGPGAAIRLGTGSCYHKQM